MSLPLGLWLLLAEAASEVVEIPPPKGTIQLHHFGPVSSLTYTRDGKTLISAGGDGLIRLWDPATGKELRRLQGHTAAVLSLALAPGGKRLASGSADGTVRFWDLATAGREMRVLQGHRYGVTSLTFSPDGKQFASADGVRLSFAVV
jgi:WD40 repeat protein